MKKIAVIFSFILSSSVQLFAQAPDWKVNESSYQFTMTIQAKLNVDGVTLANQNDMVGAFVGNTCRGVAKLTYIASTKSYYAYLTIYSNTANEAITFSIFNSTNNKITKVTKPINFNANQHIGNLFQSYSIAEPALNNKAEIVSFDFLNIKTLSSVITPSSVTLKISESFPLDNLKPVFVLSKGASLLRNRAGITSGAVATSFLTPLSYEVLSEDESTLSSYTVSVSQTLDPPLFYKKDAVCATLGAIKVVSKREGSTVQLSYNGKIMDSKPVINGEAVFLNLMTGSYAVTIGADYKVIVINLKVK
jgi:hypothetical protein